jgi:hypothetical protein
MARPTKDAPRSEHELYAAEHGLFWLPCARCGSYFGGHERGGRIQMTEASSKMTCQNCPGVYPASELNGAVYAETMRIIAEWNR